LSTFAPLFLPAAFREAVSDEAWLGAMLDAERALVRALAHAGVAPDEAAAAVAEQCEASRFDIAALAEAGRAAGNPVEPLVRALRANVGGDAARYAHYGATSQDVLDTAAMLVSRGALALLDEELRSAASPCARLADQHRSTPMAARTLLQQAVPTTFGLVAAGWLAGLVDARDRLAALELPAQLGGAAGTLAALGDAGPEVVELFADGLALRRPLLPWHSNRAPVAALAAALDAAAQAASKIGLDVVLLAQTELGEVSERDGGASSTMPQKRNPVRAVLARACGRVVHAQTGLLTGGDYELARAAGAWQAEWGALSDSLAFAGGAVAATRECLESLEVHPERMRANMSEALVTERLAFEGEDADREPTAYLGSAEALVDRVLERYREQA
jgi:3-carboxy-cis,cis-muconate cycloisomerase